MGSGFLKKKKQARAFQEHISQMQDEFMNKLGQVETIGSAGGGLVELTLNGNGELKNIRIKPECVDPEDVEGLEALIKAAHMDASAKLKEQTESNMPNLSELSMLGF